jgi:DNA helicase-2/ATP-dependent DNA helicase PcrA
MARRTKKQKVAKETVTLTRSSSGRFELKGPASFIAERGVAAGFVHLTPASTTAFSGDVTEAQWKALSSAADAAGLVAVMSVLSNELTTSPSVRVLRRGGRVVVLGNLTASVHGPILRAAGFTEEDEYWSIAETKVDESKLDALADGLEQCGDPREVFEELPEGAGSLSDKPQAVPASSSLDLSTLNEAQLSAVMAPLDQNVLVSAAPGSGKTLTLTLRIAYLLVDCGVPPSSLAAMTFTNKAAREMLARLERHIRVSGSDVALTDASVTTIHGFCAKLLRRHGSSAGIPNDFAILDESETRDMVIQCVRDALATDPPESPFSFTFHQQREATPASVGKNAATRIGLFKDTDVTPEAVKGSREHYSLFDRHIVLRVWKDYEERKRITSSLDFADLILCARQVLRDPVVGAVVARSYGHILLDEIQDTNKVQFEVIQRLAAHSKVFGVGDFNQSIYGWRGAVPHDVISTFVADYRPQLISANINYRSLPAIISVANAILADMHKGASKVIREVANAELAPRPGVPKGSPVLLLRKANADVEANDHASEIVRIVEGSGGRLNYGDVAVLFRASADTLPFETALAARSIPFVLRGTTGFFGRKEIMFLVSFLTLAATPKQDADFVRCVNTPPRGVGEALLREVQQQAVARSLSLFETCVAMLSNGGELFMKSKAAGLREFIRALSLIRSNLASDPACSPRMVLLQILKVIRYKEHLFKAEPNVAVDRWENVGQLVSLLANEKYETLSLYEADARASNLSPQQLALCTVVGDLKLQRDAHDFRSGGSSNKAGAVVLATIHSAKGLEWPLVYLPGIEEYKLPHWFSVREAREKGKDLSEEHRLFYVACTRAACQLTISYCEKRLVFGMTKTAQKSRFLTSGILKLVSNEVQPEKVDEAIRDSLPVRDDVEAEDEGVGGGAGGVARLSWQAVGALESSVSWDGRFARGRSSGDAEPRSAAASSGSSSSQQQHATPPSSSSSSSQQASGSNAPQNHGEALDTMLADVPDILEQDEGQA